METKNTDLSWVDIQGIKESLNLFKKEYQLEYGELGGKIMSIHYDDRCFNDSKIKEERERIERQVFRKMDRIFGK